MATPAPQPPLGAGYEHFRLDRQGMLVSPKTLEYYWSNAGAINLARCVSLLAARVAGPCS